MVNVQKWTSILETVTDLGIECCQKMEKERNGNSGSNGNTDNATATEDDIQLDDGYNIPVSTCDGNKKALFIGINYFGSSAELRGCINDVENIKAFITKTFNFPSDSNHMMTLTDDNKADGLPTKTNIINGMKWLVKNAQSGDSLFLHYSGHGGSQKAGNPNDEADGMDETLIPVDYEKNGVIIDNDIYDILVQGLPEGVRLTAIMDCCHSGTIMDLPYTYGVDANDNVTENDNRKALIQAAIKAGMLLISGNKKAALMAGIQAGALYFKNRREGQNDDNTKGESDITVRTALADVIQFSGCRDNQTSADASIGGESTGAMSWSFIKSFEENGLNQTYVQLLRNTRKNLHGKYSQVPQMSTGHRLDLNVPFKM